MRYSVSVAFGEGREYAFAFSADDIAGVSADQARTWFDQQYAELACNLSNPMGKVLIIDKILGVARAAGEQRFSDGQAWPSRFAQYAMLALARDTVRIDVAAFNIAY